VGNAKDHDPERYGDLRSGQARPVACRHRVPEIRDQGKQLRCPKPGNRTGNLPQAWITQAQDCSFSHDLSANPESSILLVGLTHRHQPDLLAAQLDFGNPEGWTARSEHRHG